MVRGDYTDLGLKTLSEADRGFPIPLVAATFVLVHQVPAGAIDRVTVEVAHDRNSAQDFILRISDGVTNVDLAFSVPAEEVSVEGDFFLEGGMQLLIEKQSAMGVAAALGGALRSLV